MNLRAKHLVWLFAALAALCLALPAAAAEKSPYRTWTNSMGMEFVQVPAGSFMMGSPKDEPGHRADEVLHQVTLTRAFYIQTTEVTLGQWWEVMGKPWFFRRQGGPDTPVATVSWFDAQKFIEKLNALGQGIYRLPTEAEWEYACRGGTKTAYWWGERAGCDRAMYANNTLKTDACVDSYQAMGEMPIDGPAPVKSFKPNPFGLYDTSGNLWEWCSDVFAAYPRHPATDPKGPASGDTRVRRGGSWYAGPMRLRSANRNFAHPESRYTTTGFRLVLDGRPPDKP